MAAMPSLLTGVERPAAGIKLAAAVFVVALGLTLAGWYQAELHSREAAQARFSRQASKVEQTLSRRMNDYEQMLRAGAAFYRTAPRVSREDWRDFVAGLQIRVNYAGIEGVGFAPRVAAADRARYVAGLRAQGASGYGIRPGGARDEYLPVEYLEPDSDRHRRALGFDVMSEAVRRAALERARDTGGAAVTGKIDMAGDPGVGFLMLLPVYARGADIETLEARRASLIGCVYSPFRAQEFVSTVLGPLLSRIEVELFDGSEVGADNLLFRSAGARRPAADAPALLTEDRHLNIGGRPWTLRVRAISSSQREGQWGLPVMILAGGSLVSLLLFAVIWLLSTRHARALALAESMTAEWHAQKTGLLKSQQALARFNNALDHTLDIIFMVDPETLSFVYFNEQAVREYGYSAQELRSMTLRDLNPRVNETALRALRFGSSPFREVEVTHRRKDGSEFPVEVRLQWFDEGNGTGLFVSIVRDITKRRESERLKREFVSTVSHELRTPLTSVYGSLSLITMRMANELPPRVKALVEMAHQNSERLARIVNDFLDIEKTESGAMVFHYEPVAVERIIGKAITLNRAYADQYGVTFKQLQPVPDIEVRADGDRLMQVLTNLMSNAAKFSPPGSVVQIGAMRVDDKVRVEVLDRGPGIPEQFRARVFEKFAQADSSNTRQHNGSGLGLSICKLMIEKMGGRIGFHSERGVGTTFYFDLPIWTEEPSAAPRRSQALGHTGFQSLSR